MNKAEILELASADRLSAFCDQWERGRHNGDEIHCIGNGAGVEICLTVTDIRSVVSALRAAVRDQADEIARLREALGMAKDLLDCIARRRATHGMSAPMTLRRRFAIPILPSMQSSSTRSRRDDEA